MKYRISRPIENSIGRNPSSTILFDEKAFAISSASENLFEKRITHRVELEILQDLEALRWIIQEQVEGQQFLLLRSRLVDECWILESCRFLLADQKLSVHKEDLVAEVLKNCIAKMSIKAICFKNQLSWLRWIWHDPLSDLSYFQGRGPWRKDYTIRIVACFNAIKRLYPLYVRHTGQSYRRDNLS